VSGPTLRERLAILPPLPEHPLVTIVMAVRDESRHIAAAVEGALNQDWPREQLELVVADGESRDDTPEQLRRVAARDPRVRVVANPGRFVAPGLNRALAEARGDVIVRVDGHCRVPPGYVRAGVAALRSGAAECAGGPVRATGCGAVAGARAGALCSRFGVGGASFRWARDAREVDHVPFGVWRREVFQAIGGFDEALVRNQDDELSDRLRRAGGRIRLLPGQEVEYWSRATLGGLWRQYRGYGFWKVRVIRRRGGWPSSPRHLAPAALLVSTAAGVATAALAHAAWPAAVVPALYGAFLAVATAATVASTREAAALLTPVVIPVLHAAYGTGFLQALVTREAPAPPPAAPVGADGRAREAA
jgi:succinoglycan biosynthesis protein ExoA